MSSTESDFADAIEHWNRALEADDAEDFPTAIAEYDACLCSNPDAETALEALYNLGLAINNAYDLTSGISSNEQLSWRYCELACCEQAAQIYEEYPYLWQSSDIGADEIYFDVQAVLQGPVVTNETTAVKTGSYVDKAKQIKLLRFFSDGIHLRFDSDGESLPVESSVDSSEDAIDDAPISVQTSDENGLEAAVF